MKNADDLQRPDEARVPPKRSLLRITLIVLAALLPALLIVWWLVRS